MESDLWGIIGVILILAGGVYIFYTSNARKKKWQSMVNEQQKVSYPLRLQASERMILFLERIRPHSLLTRVNTEGMSVFDLQSAILKQVKSEFEHNAAQQLYLSKNAWEKISAAAAAVPGSMVHTISTKANDKPAKDAVVFLLQNEDHAITSMINEAIEAIKEDVQKNF